MSEIWQTGPGRRKAIDPMGRLMIALADRLRLAGRHSDAKAMIDMAFQQFDTEPEESAEPSYFSYDRKPPRYTNDNDRWPGLPPHRA